MTSDISIIILAGGKSSRFGTDKVQAEFSSKTLIENAIELSKGITGNIIIITNQEGCTNLGFPTYPDIYRDKGPLGGIHSGLTNSNSQYNFVIPVDMPNLTEPLINYIIEKATIEANCVIPMVNGLAEPLCGVYNKRAITTIEKCLESGKLKMMDVLKELKTTYIQIDSELSFYSPHLFSNINTKEDMENIKRLNNEN